MTYHITYLNLNFNQYVTKFLGKQETDSNCVHFYFIIKMNESYLSSSRYAICIFF